MLTHAAGVIMSAVALVVMLVLAAGEPLKIVAGFVFGITLLLLYSSSALYHFLTSVKWKARAQALDHACIYLLIAGTYTPITLITLRGVSGWVLFGVVWALALVGVLIKTVVRGKRDHWISTALYLAMGWLIVFAIGPLLRGLPLAGMIWLVAGGLFYTFGIVFYAWHRLPYNHAIWHLYVLSGSACHVVAVSCYVFQ